MITYNRSLDYVTLAMAHGRKGNHEMAAKLFAKAIQASDAVKAIGILEASNKEAYEATAKAKKVAAAKKPVAAAKRIKAADEEFEMGDEDELEGLVGDGEEEEEPVEGAAEDEDDAEMDDEEFNKEFAKVLSNLAKTRKPKK